MQPKNGVIIRPMLWASREEIRQYAAENNIIWREDHTNAETVYLRNKIRNQLLPVFDELHPEARQGLYKSLEHLASENELYRELLKEKLNQIIEHNGEIQSIPHSAFFIQHSAFLKVPEPVEGPTLSYQLLFEWLRNYGFNTNQCHFIFDAMETGIGNKYYSPTHQLVIGRNELQLSEIKSIEDEEIQIEIGEDEIFSPIHIQFSKLQKTVDFVIDKSPEVAQLDFDKIHFPLTLRHWHHGDRFHPLGMKGSKLLSDFFVDQKFTEAQKEHVFLLVSADNQILWVVGYRIDDRYKVTNSTKTIFLCRQIPMEK
jgi:tRNA(Ile)-lysidine synthase